MTTHSGNGSAPGSRVSVWISFFCFAESHSFASQQKFIPGGGDGESCADRQMSLRRRTHAREPGPVTFPNTSRPTTNNSCSSHLSHGDGSRYGALCHRHTFYLVFRTRSENVTFADFPYFRPHVTSRAGTHSVLLEPFPI